MGLSRGFGQGGGHRLVFEVPLHIDEEQILPRLVLVRPGLDRGEIDTVVRKGSEQQRRSLRRLQYPARPLPEVSRLIGSGF